MFIVNLSCYVSIIGDTTDIYLIGSPITRLFAMLTVVASCVSLFIYIYIITYLLAFVKSKTPIVTNSLQFGAQPERGGGGMPSCHNSWWCVVPCVLTILLFLFVCHCVSYIFTKYSDFRQYENENFFRYSENSERQT